MRRQYKINTNWREELAYAIGVITSDGNLSIDGRHINITSKDLDLIMTVRRCLGLSNKVGVKKNGYSSKLYFVVQFSDKNFYEFLLRIGLTPKKSKIIKRVDVPDKFFRDFLRGCIDGDGSISISHNKNSCQIQLKLRLASASLDFLRWIKDNIRERFNINRGWIVVGESSSQLCYGKSDSIQLLKIMYNPTRYFLYRKYQIAKSFI